MRWKAFFITTVLTFGISTSASAWNKYQPKPTEEQIVQMDALTLKGVREQPIEARLSSITDSKYTFITSEDDTVIVPAKTLSYNRLATHYGPEIREITGFLLTDFLNALLSSPIAPIDWNNSEKIIRIETFDNMLQEYNLQNLNSIHPDTSYNDEKHNDLEGQVFNNVDKLRNTTLLERAMLCPEPGRGGYMWRFYVDPSTNPDGYGKYTTAFNWLKFVREISIFDPSNKNILRE